MTTSSASFGQMITAMITDDPRRGFDHQAAVEIEDVCTDTLRLNRPGRNVVTKDIREFDGHDYRGVDLLAGGVRCSPFSIAGKQLGADDERDLFPEALRIIREARPTAIMLENVRALATARFVDYRVSMSLDLERLDHMPTWKGLNASAFGVPQLRPRFVLVAVKRPYFTGWQWPPTSYWTPPTVGEALEDLMAVRGWPGAHRWAQMANGVGPTIVGGSKKHGGPDLGPTRARQEWKCAGGQRPRGGGRAARPRGLRRAPTQADGSHGSTHPGIPGRQRPGRRRAVSAVRGHRLVKSAGMDDATDNPGAAVTSDG